jgi:choline dehydrogenase-like flavoprotein
LNWPVEIPPLSSLLKKNGCRIPEKINLGDLEAMKNLTQSGSTTYHPWGTRAMMSKDLGGGLGGKLGIYGVQGLKVVDPSVFPPIRRGNIQSSVYADAEKAADILKEHFEGRS